jgi:hypothetical protein
MFCMNTLASELDGTCIPAMRCLRVTHVIKVTTEIAYLLVTACQRLWQIWHLTERQRFFTSVHPVTPSRCPVWLIR